MFAAHLLLVKITNLAWNWPNTKCWEFSKCALLPKGIFFLFKDRLRKFQLLKYFLLIQNLESNWPTSTPSDTCKDHLIQFSTQSDQFVGYFLLHNFSQSICFSAKTHFTISLCHLVRFINSFKNRKGYTARG